ncbi:hypothetical protein HPB50_014063 [Hyalomma asiaticum]|uniref:Uncharacterized protein n=1 Tax=Hyalomma asiaticum TaxID=266040 RepID=A0ACB7S6B7_HYAAI|nr:hypothetical protein HPB50_014063 [Hyalomma asiaticum]
MPSATDRNQQRGQPSSYSGRGGSAAFIREHRSKGPSKMPVLPRIRMSRWKHRRCVVYGCEGDSNGITTHRVPQDAKLRHMWLQRIGVLSSALKTDIYVCRRHFSSDDYVRNPEVMRAVGFHAFHRKYVLKRGAVPSLNLPTDPARERYTWAALKIVAQFLAAAERELLVELRFATAAAAAL